MEVCEPRRELLAERCSAACWKVAVFFFADCTRGWSEFNVQTIAGRQRREQQSPEHAEEPVLSGRLHAQSRKRMNLVNVLGHELVRIA